MLFRNLSDREVHAQLPIRFSVEESTESVTCNADGRIYSGDHLRGIIGGSGDIALTEGTVRYAADLKDSGDG